MKKILTGFIIGTALASACWYFTTKTSAKGMDGKKERSPGFSETPQGNYPGLKFRDTDFLIPINRLMFTEYVHVDTSEDDMGSWNKPMTALVFNIFDGETTHTFMASGEQNKTISELKYLGRNISIKKVNYAGNGYYMTTYKDVNGKIGYGYVSSSYITGSEPDKTPVIAQDLVIDRRKLNVDKINRKYFDNIDLATMFIRFQDAVRRDDRNTVVEYFSYPIEFCGETYFTKHELLGIYDKIFTQNRKEDLFKCSPKNIKQYKFYYLLPGDFLCDQTKEATPILTIL